MKSDAKPASVKKGRAPEDDRSAAQRVLRIEGEGLEALSAALNEDDSLTKAADLLESLEGRLVVTGMGKSGHIARKIAATLASTGTPALYVHPGEASHGDLGMVGREDAVLALSNSGNTAELADIIGYTRRFSIPLIAMTARGDSQLAEQADIRLLLPRAPEACPMGLAPTTSTTLMLALGDALAVVLLERKGFSASDFAVFHPGGSLGGQLLRVQDVMHGGGELPLSPPDALMSEAIVRMTAAGFGCIGIADRHHHRRRPAAAHGRGPFAADRGGGDDPLPQDDPARGPGRRGPGLHERESDQFALRHRRRPSGGHHPPARLPAGRRGLIGVA